MSKKQVSAFVFLNFPTGIDLKKAVQKFYDAPENKKADRKVEVLIEAYGQAREFTIDELLTKLGFNVPSSN